MATTERMVKEQRKQGVVTLTTAGTAYKKKWGKNYGKKGATITIQQKQQKQ
jgi:hypothetical protein